jgi:hypothetical protein
LDRKQKCALAFDISSLSDIPIKVFIGPLRSEANE